MIRFRNDKETCITLIDAKSLPAIHACMVKYPCHSHKLDRKDLEIFLRVFSQVDTDDTAKKTSYKKAFKMVEAYCRNVINYEKTDHNIFKKATKREIWIIMAFCHYFMPCWQYAKFIKEDLHTALFDGL